jgi:hypothetical protein
MITKRGLKPGQLVWQADYSETTDNKGKIEASVSFECDIGSVAALRPKKGAPCLAPGANGRLKLDSSTVENIGHDRARVICKYIGGTSEEEFTFDDDSGDYRTELSISTSEEPIETHYRYRELTPADRINIAHLKAGRMKPTENENEYLLKTDSPNGKKFTFTDEKAAELAGKIAKGIVSYLACNQTYRIQYTSSHKLSSGVLNSVGKIATPKGAPSINESRSWLFIGASANEQGDSYNITLEYRLSGPGGWDENIYGEDSEE